MKIHRFYVSDIRLEQDFWFSDKAILHQWVKVLRFRAGQKIVLFDGRAHDRLYTITSITPEEAHLALVTEQKRHVPNKELYLFWSLLKKDKNDWVLQKCTELGVGHFVPVVADRSEKTGFNIERAQKIIIEASEQCGRSDIPTVQSAMRPETIIDHYTGKVELYVCEQHTETITEKRLKQTSEPVGLFIGPEGGWTEDEKALFADKNVGLLPLHTFTLRAETAAVAAVVQGSL